MNKIVIRGSHSDPDDPLIECIRMLFPECEIQILSKGAEGLGVVPPIEDFEASGKGDKKHPTFWGNSKLSDDT